MLGLDPKLGLAMPTEREGQVELRKTMDIQPADFLSVRRYVESSKAAVKVAEFFLERCNNEDTFRHRLFHLALRDQICKRLYNLWIKVLTLSALDIGQSLFMGPGRPVRTIAGERIPNIDNSKETGY